MGRTCNNSYLALRHLELGHGEAVRAVRGGEQPLVAHQRAPAEPAVLGGEGSHPGVLRYLGTGGVGNTGVLRHSSASR